MVEYRDACIHQANHEESRTVLFQFEVDIQNVNPHEACKLTGSYWQKVVCQHLDS
jgi:hypothetical protein